LKPHAAARVLLLAGALCMLAAAGAQQVAIETNGQGESITVTASAEMRVDPRTAWSVITDYDRLAEFIPYMRSSRVVRRASDHFIVEQTGEFGFLWFNQPVQARLAVVEVPPRSVDEPRSEDEEALEDASAVVVEPDDDVDESPAESALAVPPEVPPLPLVPPEVVELLVAAACGGGALDAAAKMKFGVGT